jgi:hypothetical protein
MRFAIAVLLSPLFASLAMAQPMPPQAPLQRPSASPYLSLLSRGNNGNFGGAAITYAGVVRPIQQGQQQNAMLQQQLNQSNQNFNAFAQAVASADGTNPLITGKGATFNNTSHFFNNINGQGGGGMGGGLASGFNVRGNIAGGMQGSRGIGQAPGAGASRGRR